MCVVIYVCVCVYVCVCLAIRVHGCVGVCACGYVCMVTYVGLQLLLIFYVDHRARCGAICPSTQMLVDTLNCRASQLRLRNFFSIMAPEYICIVIFLYIFLFQQTIQALILCPPNVYLSLIYLDALGRECSLTVLSMEIPNDLWWKWT